MTAPRQKYVLLQDLYGVSAPDDNYRLLVVNELKEFVNASYKAGEIFEYYPEDGTMINENGDIGVGTEGPEPAVWKKLEKESDWERPLPDIERAAILGYRIMYSEWEKTDHFILQIIKSEIER